MDKKVQENRDVIVVKRKLSDLFQDSIYQLYYAGPQDKDAPKTEPEVSFSGEGGGLFKVRVPVDIGGTDRAEYCPTLAKYMQICKEFNVSWRDLSTSIKKQEDGFYALYVHAKPEKAKVVLNL